MQQVNPDNSLGTLKDLERDFVGLKYLKCEGLEAKGKPRIYTESYSTSDTLRVYIPDTITRDATTITLTLAFTGTNRRNVYDSFYQYIKKGRFKFWDTVRNKEALLVLTNEVSPTDDILIGSDPYIECQYKFQNLYGECKKHV